MRYILLISTIIFALLLSCNLNAQKMKIENDSREVVMNYPDSTVKANISLEEKKYKPKTNQVYYWYKSNEIKKNLGGYSGRLLNGKYTCYDLEKNMIAEGHFKFGVKTGTWKRWFPKGGLEKIEQYKNGKKHGEFVFYHPNGHLNTVINYKNGFLHGKYTEYLNDTTLRTRQFKKGEEVLPKIKEEDNAQKENIQSEEKPDKKNKRTKDSEESDEMKSSIEKKEKEKTKLSKEEKQILKQQKLKEKELEKEKKQREKEQTRLEKEKDKSEQNSPEKK